MSPYSPLEALLAKMHAGTTLRDRVLRQRKAAWWTKPKPEELAEGEPEEPANEASEEEQEL